MIRLAISLLNKVASDLKRLAVDNQCVVVVINHEASKNRPSLGRYWWHVPHLRLHSQRLSAGRFQLTVVGSVYGPPGPQRCCFELSPATWKQSHRRTRWNSTLAAVSASIREQSGRWPFFFLLIGAGHRTFQANEAQLSPTSRVSLSVAIFAWTCHPDCNISSVATSSTISP